MKPSDVKTVDDIIAYYDDAGASACDIYEHIVGGGETPHALTLLIDGVQITVVGEYPGGSTQPVVLVIDNWEDSSQRVVTVIQTHDELSRFDRVVTEVAGEHYDQDGTRLDCDKCQSNEMAHHPHPQGTFTLFYN